MRLAMRAIKKSKRVRATKDVPTHDAALRAIHSMFTELGIPPSVWLHMTYDQIHEYLEHRNEVNARAKARAPMKHRGR